MIGAVLSMDEYNYYSYYIGFDHIKIYLDDIIKIGINKNCEHFECYDIKCLNLIKNILYYSEYKDCIFFNKIKTDKIKSMKVFDTNYSYEPMRKFRAEEMFIYPKERIFKEEEICIK